MPEFKLTNNKAPCLDCQNRTLGCHSKCKQYKAYDNHNKKDRVVKFQHHESERDFVLAINYLTYRKLY